MPQHPQSTQSQCLGTSEQQAGNVANNSQLCLCLFSMRALSQCDSKFVTKMQLKISTTMSVDAIILFRTLLSRMTTPSNDQLHINLLGRYKGVN